MATSNYSIPVRRAALPPYLSQKEEWAQGVADNISSFATALTDAPNRSHVRVVPGSNVDIAENLSWGPAKEAWLWGFVEVENPLGFADTEDGLVIRVACSRTWRQMPDVFFPKADDHPVEIQAQWGKLTGFYPGVPLSVYRDPYGQLTGETVLSPRTVDAMARTVGERFDRKGDEIMALRSPDKLWREQYGRTVRVEH
ncbi:MAG: hypothetical protein HYS81_00320 [Candidatus Aenigmatarchaeota archaeon]|nr:MAG: hypothetical protein HYS81_00320 [Candidatus Aenigmarchaeota archaeon]